MTDSVEPPAAVDAPPAVGVGGTIGRIALVAATAVLLGGLTIPAQALLPDELSSFANSAGGWTLLTFTIVGVLTGPIVGAAAALVRHHRPLGNAVGIAPVASVLIGEGVYGLTVVAATTSPVYWIVQLVIGVGLTAVVIIRTRMPARLAAFTIGLVAAGSAAFVAFYVLLGGV